MHPGYVEVTIFGQKYKLKADSQENSYLSQIAKVVDDMMNNAHNKNPHFKPTKLAILTALNLADELYKIKEAASFNNEINVFSEKLEDLINKLDNIT